MTKSSPVLSTITTARPAMTARKFFMLLSPRTAVHAGGPVCRGQGGAISSGNARRRSASIVHAGLRRRGHARRMVVGTRSARARGAVHADHCIKTGQSLTGGARRIVRERGGRHDLGRVGRKHFGPA